MVDAERQARIDEVLPKAARLLLNAHHFLRVSLSSPDASIDPRDYCVEPVVTTNPQGTLERVLMSAKLGESHARDRGIILLWGAERRIITHFDVLRRLFEGVFTPAPSVAPQAE